MDRDLRTSQEIQRLLEPSVILPCLLPTRAASCSPGLAWAACQPTLRCDPSVLPCSLALPNRPRPPLHYYVGLLGHLSSHTPVGPVGQPYLPTSPPPEEGKCSYTLAWQAGLSPGNILNFHLEVSGSKVKEFCDMYLNSNPCGAGLKGQGLFPLKSLRLHTSSPPNSSDCRWVLKIPSDLS